MLKYYEKTLIWDCPMDELSVGGVTLLHAGLRVGLMGNTVFLLMFTSTCFCISPRFTDETISVLHVFGLR
jgi:hypothetical protein